MKYETVPRLGFVSTPTIEAIIVETEMLDAVSFRITGDCIEIIGKNGSITARGNPGLYGMQLLKQRSEIRIAALGLKRGREYFFIPKQTIHP